MRTFSFLEPKIIMTTIVVMIIFAVGVFAFFTLWANLEDNQAIDTSDTKCKTVVDASVSQIITIPEGATITRVYETLNTGAVNDISPSDYTHDGRTVTITVTG